MLLERDYYVGFSNCPGIGPVKFNLLLSKFGSAKTAWKAPRRPLTKLLGEALSLRFEEFRREFSIEKYLEKLKNSPAGEVWFVTDKDKDYPKSLLKISRPPFVLYGRGNLEVLEGSTHSLNDSSTQSLNNLQSLHDKTLQNSKSVARFKSSFREESHPLNSIAVVGTRKMTRYGEEVTESLTSSLVNHGFTIISGLAIGVDAVAHKAAIENGGSTIAVLGCGVDCCTPTENLSLYNSIVKNGGCIISEYPLSQIPTKGSFPARNRIIAGLSAGVLVTEGAEDSGSLITADYALKFGRKVFAVPGPITSSLSKGPFKLLQKGAKLVTGVEDILKELKTQMSKVKSASQKSKVGATKEEGLILKLLENEAMNFDEIVRRSKIKSAKLGSLLSLMEVKGLIKSLDQGMFSVSS